jgi:hypothetical protein
LERLMLSCIDSDDKWILGHDDETIEIRKQTGSKRAGRW